MKVLKFILLIISVIILYEYILCKLRKNRRKALFTAAKERAKLTNKKLLVIGDPYNGIASIITDNDYNYGDLCIDLTGCPKCENAIKGRLEDVISTINLNEYIIYISSVLEYTDDLPLILNYLNKVDPNDLFIVTVEWYSLNAYFYPYYLNNERCPRYIIYSTNPIKYLKNLFFN